jgi:hypothetical protein
MLGGFDKNDFIDELIYHPVILKSWWSLKLKQILVNNIDTNLCN